MMFVFVGGGGEWWVGRGGGGVGVGGGGCTLSMKITTYAPPFQPPFWGLWKICIVSTPILGIRARMYTGPALKGLIVR